MGTWKSHKPVKYVYFFLSCTGFPSCTPSCGPLGLCHLEDVHKIAPSTRTGMIDLKWNALPWKEDRTRVLCDSRVLCGCQKGLYSLVIVIGIILQGKAGIIFNGVWLVSFNAYGKHFQNELSNLDKRLQLHGLRLPSPDDPRRRMAEPRKNGFGTRFMKHNAGWCS